MKSVSIYLYTDDGAKVNCEIKDPSSDQLLILQSLLDATNNPTSSAVIASEFAANMAEIA